MYRNFFTNKWVLGGIVFLIVFGVACVLWYHYDTAPYKQDAAKTDELLRQRETTQKANSNNNMDSKTNFSEKSNPPSIERTASDLNDIHLETNTNTEVEKKDSKEIRVSPHGFGPYPEIPEGTLIGEFNETDSVNSELLGRVLVKLWNDGDRHLGGWISGETGKVYPHYDNVVYVEYENQLNELTGEWEMNIVSANSAPSTSFDTNFELHNSVLEGNIPVGYKLIDVDGAGIAPYEFLDLPK